MTHPELALTQTDWTRFLTPEALAEKAGTSRANFPRMTLKELADKAADAGGAFLEVIDVDTVVIADTGQGIAACDLAGVFSIKRPLVSTKHWRIRPCPTQSYPLRRHPVPGLCRTDAARETEGRRGATEG